MKKAMHHALLDYEIYASMKGAITPKNPGKSHIG